MAINNLRWIVGVAMVATSFSASAQTVRDSTSPKPARPLGLVVVETVISPLQPNIILPKVLPQAASSATSIEATISNAAAKEAVANAEATRVTANVSGTVIDEIREKGQPAGLRVNTGFSQYDLNGANATSRVPGFGPVRATSVPMWSVFGW